MSPNCMGHLCSPPAPRPGQMTRFPWDLTQSSHEVSVRLAGRVCGGRCMFIFHGSYDPFLLRSGRGHLRGPDRYPPDGAGAACEAPTDIPPCGQGPTTWPRPLSPLRHGATSGPVRRGIHTDGMGPFAGSLPSPPCPATPAAGSWHGRGRRASRGRLCLLIFFL